MNSHGGISYGLWEPNLRHMLAKKDEVFYFTECKNEKGEKAYWMSGKDDVIDVTKISKGDDSTTFFNTLGQNNSYTFLVEFLNSFLWTIEMANWKGCFRSN